MTAPPNTGENYKPNAEVGYITKDFAVNDLEYADWRSANPLEIGKYWSGEKAPAGRRLEARMLWSETALYVRFDAAQSEPLVISESPVTEAETLGLWDRDVCELFIAPDHREFRKYFEFEIAPTGEWLDLAIHQKPSERITDWNYRSGMETAAEIRKGSVVMAIRIEWKAFGQKPSTGDTWFGNLYRAVGEGASRGYLAWSPTFTERPDFHVPERFGTFVFCEL